MNEHSHGNEIGRSVCINLLGTLKLQLHKHEYKGTKTATKYESIIFFITVKQISIYCKRMSACKNVIWSSRSPEIDSMNNVGHY